MPNAQSQIGNMAHDTFPVQPSTADAEHGSPESSGLDKQDDFHLENNQHSATQSGDSRVSSYAARRRTALGRRRLNAAQRRARKPIRRRFKRKPLMTKAQFSVHIRKVAAERAAAEARRISALRSIAGRRGALARARNVAEARAWAAAGPEAIARRDAEIQQAVEAQVSAMNRARDLARARAAARQQAIARAKAAARERAKARARARAQARAAARAEAKAQAKAARAEAKAQAMAARAAAKAEAAAARAASRAAAKAQKAAAKNKVAPVANGGMSVQAESKPNVQQDDFSLSQPTGHSSPAAMPAAAFSPVVKMEEFDTMESLSQQLSAEPVVEQSFTEMLYGSESEDQDSFMTQAFDDEFEQFFKPEPIKQEPVDEQAYAVPTAAPYTTSLLTGPVTDITLPSFPLMFGAGYTDLEDNLSFSPGPANPFAHNYVQDLNSLYSPQLCPCQDFQCPPRNWPMQNVVRLGWCPVRDMPTLFLETLPAMASNGQFMAQYPGQAFGH